jgi:hypothetical protein
MTDFDRSIAREVHALLLSAHPQAADINLTKAAELASAASDTTMRPNDDFREYTLLAIQNAMMSASSYC